MYNRNMKTPSIQVVEETPFGLYVWEIPDGRWVGDDEGNFMNIPAKKGDIKRIAELRDAAKAHGVTEGRPVFLSGKKRVTDEQYEEQRQRLLFGLTPDPEDEFAQLDELKYGRA
jgi:hypothetical protein